MKLIFTFTFISLIFTSIFTSCALQNGLYDNINNIINPMPPEIQSTTPAHGSINIVDDGSLIIEVVFTDDMNSSTINNGTISMQSISPVVINAGISISYNAASRTAIINPVDQLSDYFTYEITLTTGIQSIYGDSITHAYSFSFTIEESLIPYPTYPYVVYYSPVTVPSPGLFIQFNTNMYTLASWNVAVLEFNSTDHDPINTANYSTGNWLVSDNDVTINHTPLASTKFIIVKLFDFENQANALLYGKSGLQKTLVLL